jgi:hypothetical protein
MTGASETPEKEVKAYCQEGTIEIAERGVSFFVNCAG